MKIKIISDGTGRGTRVVTEDGEVLERVLSIKWECVGRQDAVATIEVSRVPVELVARDE